MANREQDRQVRRKRQSGPPLLEWISAAFGTLALLTLVTLIAVDALRTSGKEPPVLAVAPVAVTRANGSYVVEVEVRNLSPATAAAVEIEGKLERGGSEEASAATTLAYVPGRSKRSAGLIFDRDPRQYRLSVQATGYEEP